MEESRPIHEVFLPLARQVAKAMEGRVGRMQDVHDNEPFTVAEKSNDDGTTTLLYSRTRVHDGAVEFKNIASAGIGDTIIGDETINHSDTLGSNEEDVYNPVGDVEVDFADTFAETDSEEDSSSEGTSLKVSAEGEGGVEGFGSFKSSVEAEAHAEFTQSEGHETSRGSEGDNKTTIPKGVHAKIIETRSRADGVATATTTGKFSFAIGAGHHSGGKFVSYHHGVGHVYFKILDSVCGRAQARRPEQLAAGQRLHPSPHGPEGHRVGDQGSGRLPALYAGVHGPRETRLQGSGPST